MFARTIIAVMLLGTLAGCTAGGGAAPADVRPARYSDMTLDCIFIRTIDNWKYLDPYHAIIYAPEPSSAYLVELSNYCQPLQRAERIGISAHIDGQLCAHDRDALIVGDQRCPITTITRYRVAADAPAPR